MLLGYYVVLRCDTFRGASGVRYSPCRNRARVDVGLSVGISVTVSVSSDKVLAVVVLVKPLFRWSVLSCRLSGESQTNCARLVKVRIVVAFERGRVVR